MKGLKVITVVACAFLMMISGQALAGNGPGDGTGTGDNGTGDGDCQA